MGKNASNAGAKNDQTTPPAPKVEIREVGVLEVRSVGKSFRRLGVAFTQEHPTYLNPDALSKEQLQVLKDESSLRIIGAKIAVALTEGAPEALVLVPVADATATAGTDE